MKNIAINNLTLAIKNADYDKLDKEYAESVGRISSPTLDAMLENSLRLLGSHDLIRGCKYTVTEYTANGGYAKSCKYSRNSVVVLLSVEKIAGNKYSLVGFKTSRISLRPGEYATEHIHTEGEYARKCHIAKLIGGDAENPCWIKGLKTFDYDETKKASKLIWKRFIENINDFEV